MLRGYSPSPVKTGPTLVVSIASVGFGSMFPSSASWNKEEILRTLESRILPGNPVETLRSIRFEPTIAWVLMDYLCFLQQQSNFLSFSGVWMKIWVPSMAPTVFRNLKLQSLLNNLIAVGASIWLWGKFVKFEDIQTILS